MQHFKIFKTIQHIVKRLVVGNNRQVVLQLISTILLMGLVQKSAHAEPIISATCSASDCGPTEVSVPALMVLICLGLLGIRVTKKTTSSGHNLQEHIS